jgi:ribosomal protein S18 acetylase RimI-like enzyme
VTGDGPVPEPVLAFLTTVTRMPEVTCFLATLDGQPAGGAAVGISEGMAALFGAGTRSAFRNRGVQSALVRARLAHAAARGCDTAMVITESGTVSQRNMERQGFGIVHTRSKLLREHGSSRARR